MHIGLSRSEQAFSGSHQVVIEQPNILQKFWSLQIVSEMLLLKVETTFWHPLLCDVVYYHYCIRNTSRLSVQIVQLSRASPDQLMSALKALQQHLGLFGSLPACKSINKYGWNESSLWYKLVGAKG